jgi:hypothetical protein
LVNVVQHEPLKLETPEIKWLAPEKGESSWFWSVGNVPAQSVLPKACTPEVRSIFQLDPQDLVDIKFHATILQMQGELGKLGLLTLEPGSDEFGPGTIGCNDAHSVQQGL